MNPRQWNDYEAFIERMNEKQPPFPRLLYRPGDKVKAARPSLVGFVPAGALGEVLGLEPPASIQSAQKRPFWVRFDVRPFNIPLSLEMWAKERETEPGAEPFLKVIEINAGANDLLLVEKGPNWGPDYEHTYSYDALMWAARETAPDDFKAAMGGITDGILGRLGDKATSQRAARIQGRPETWVKPTERAPGASSNDSNSQTPTPDKPGES